MSDRCAEYGHQFRTRQGRPHRRCYYCGAANPAWSVFRDPRIDRDSSGCWIWMGARTAAGYGRFGGRAGGEYVHRIAWEEANGESAEGFEIIHSCDNPSCCNPAHLSRATHQENMSDARSKGRLDLSGLQRRGEWTHCIRGHLFSQENVYISPKGTRECRICRRANWARWRRENRAKR